MVSKRISQNIFLGQTNKKLEKNPGRRLSSQRLPAEHNGGETDLESAWRPAVPLTGTLARGVINEVNSSSCGTLGLQLNLSYTQTTRESNRTKVQ